MAGKPFKVGRFAHTLRVRLMREHLGVDVDNLDEEDLMANDPVKPEHAEEPWDPDSEQTYGQEKGVTHIKKSKQRTAVGVLVHDTLGGASQGTANFTRVEYVSHGYYLFSCPRRGRDNFTHNF